MFCCWFVSRAGHCVQKCPSWDVWESGLLRRHVSLNFFAAVIKMVKVVNITWLRPAPACYSLSPTDLECDRALLLQHIAQAECGHAPVFDHVSESLTHSWQTHDPGQKSSWSNCFLPSLPSGTGAVTSLDGYGAAQRLGGECWGPLLPLSDFFISYLLHGLY